MKVADQVKILDDATTKAIKQVQKESKTKRRSIIDEWFRYVELVAKYKKTTKLGDTMSKKKTKNIKMILKEVICICFIMKDMTYNFLHVLIDGMKQ